jgi:5-methylcytosine-specific restriction endonuclease McrA
MAELERLWGSFCLKCGALDALTWDHVLPLSKGGAHSIDNLQRLCSPCNEIKQAGFADYRSGAQKAWALTFQRVTP